MAASKQHYTLSGQLSSILKEPPGQSAAYGCHSPSIYSTLAYVPESIEMFMNRFVTVIESQDDVRSPSVFLRRIRAVAVLGSRLVFTAAAKSVSKIT